METISDLTDATSASAGAIALPNILPPCTIGFIPPPANETSSGNKKSGRPKGSSAQSARVKDYHGEMLVDGIATEWQERVQLAEGKRMSRNALDALAKQKQEEHELTRFEIKQSLIRQRVMTNKPICPPHAGTESPMALVEQLMQQMAKLRQPLNISEGLSLANSLVEGTKWEDTVVNFKVNRGWNPIDEQGNKKPILGKKWYNNFWKKGHKFSKDRSEWSIHRNFVQMYDKVYEAMETAGVAKSYQNQCGSTKNNN
jgi:hypothetical protein